MESEVATQVQPVELIHRRTPATAFHYDGTEANRQAIIAWSGGRCFETNGTLAEFWCDSPQGRRPIYAGDTVLHNRHDHYYPVGQDVADGDYDTFDPAVGETAKVRRRLLEHLDDTMHLVDALEPDRIDEDMAAAIERVHSSTDAVLAAVRRGR